MLKTWTEVPEVSEERRAHRKELLRARRITKCLTAAIRRMPYKWALIEKWQGISLRHYLGEEVNINDV